MGTINKTFKTKVYFSDGNTKMGAVPSVSLPPVVTCHNCAECSKKCYARRMYNRLPVVREQYDANLELLHNDPERYFSDIGKVMQYYQTFRWHVSGDIVDRDYLENMCKLAENNPNCVQLAFTKNYSDVNAYLSCGGKIPDNLHILMSVWAETRFENPFDLPECHIMYKNGETTAGKDFKTCDGNCFMCFCEHKGCIGLKRGEQLVINEH